MKIFRHAVVLALWGLTAIAILAAPAGVRKPAAKANPKIETPAPSPAPAPARNPEMAIFSGKVTDPDGMPVSKASVLIPALNLHAHTDGNGIFRIENLPRGVFAVKIQKDGLPSRVETIDLKGKDVEIAVALDVAHLKNDTVVLSSFRPTDEIDMAQAVTVIEGKKLDRARGQSLMETVQDTPGVANFGTGNFVGKPVIRGLASYRSLILVDGQREEGQQFGDEHGPNMDIYDMQRVEIVRGPGSLLYGSDALGGVMNVITPELPTAQGGAETLSGRFIGNGFSNNPGSAGGFSLAGATGIFGYRSNFSYRQAGNQQTPDGEIANSQYKNLNGSALVGITEKWGMLSLRYSHYDMTLNLPEPMADPNDASKQILDTGATSYQKVNHERVQVKSLIETSIAKLDIAMTYQQNHRQEFDSNLASASGLNLLLDTFDTQIKAHHKPIGPLLGTIGLSYINQRNQTLGNEALIPSYDSNSYGAYLFEELRWEEFSLLGGVRGDTRLLNAKQNDSLAVDAQTVQNSAVTGSFGAVWRFMKGWSLFGNIGRGFRAPTAFELFSNGIHEGTGIFEIGQKDLQSETSVTTDGGIKVRKGIFRAELNGYYNKINNYIYALPNGTTYTDPDTGNLYPQYVNQQGNATIYGGEFDMEAAVLKWLTLNGGIDIVKGRNDTLNEPLPLIPANRYRLGVTFTGNKLGDILNPYLNIKARYVARKTELSGAESQFFANPNSDASVTATTYSGFADYTVLSASIGGDFAVGSKLWTLTIGGDNLLNQKYVDYLSRQKTFAFNPGVSVFFKLTAPFDLIH